MGRTSLVSDGNFRHRLHSTHVWYFALWGPIGSLRRYLSRLCTVLWNALIRKKSSIIIIINTLTLWRQLKWYLEVDPIAEVHWRRLHFQCRILMSWRWWNSVLPRLPLCRLRSIWHLMSICRFWQTVVNRELIKKGAKGYSNGLHLVFRSRCDWWLRSGQF